MSIPPDINDSLIDSANKAANGSDIIHRVGNDPAGSMIDTLSGPVPSIKEWYAQQSVRIDDDVAESIESVTEQAQAAEVSAQLSQSAASMAAAFINPSADTAEGLGKTSGTGTTNRWFTVPIAGSPALFTLYRNDANVAVKIGEAPSSAVVNIARRGNYVLQGYVSKAAKIGSTKDWSVSWGRIYIFTGTGKARANIQAVTDLTVPDGQCAYVDLNEALVGGEYIVHVSTIALTSASNPAGSYIDDSKIILFTCLNDIIGGFANPQSPGSISKTSLDASLTNRTNRPTYSLIGDITSFTLNGTSVVLSSPDLRLTRGVGNTSRTINALASVQVPIGQALYIDLDDPLVDEKISAKVTTGGYSSAAGGLVSGAFVEDNKVYLFINELLGYGGLLAHRRPSVSRVGQVWLKQGAAITFDAVTRTLAWSAGLILPTIGGQGRISLEAGSYTFSNLTNNVAYLDLDAAVVTGTTPVTAVKGGQYYDGTNAARFRGLPNQVPMFYWNGSGDFGSLNGFPAATVTGGASGALADNDIVVRTDVGLGRVFVKGTKSGSTKYIEFNVAHEVKPFDPTGADAFGNADIWRLKNTYEADIVPGSTSFARARSGIPLMNGGEIVAAWKVQGAEDYIGGYHGDEIKTNFVMLLDGIEIPPDAAATLVGKKLEYVQYSKLYQCNTQIEVATHMVHVTITRSESGPKVDMKQKVTWSKSLILDSSMMTMLPLKRLLNNTFGPVITDTAMRAPYASKEDVSVVGFPRIITLGSLPDAKLWGPTGISASVEIIKHPGLASCGFYVANDEAYNKLYYSVGGSGLTTMGGLPHTTTIGESWEVESVIELNTAL